jgi:hypothetical protein
LHLQVDVAYLVEKHRAVISHLQEALLGADRAGERSLLVAKQFRLQQLARQAGTVEIEKSFFRSRAIAVNPVGQNTLPGAGFALQQNRALAAQDAAGNFSQAADCRARSDKWIYAFPFRFRRCRQQRLTAPVAAQHPQQCRMQCRKIYRLHQKLLGCLLNGAGASGEVCLTQEHQHANGWVDGSHVPQ